VSEQSDFMGEFSIYASEDWLRHLQVYINKADFVLLWHTAVTKPTNQNDFKGKDINDATRYINEKPVDKLFFLDHKL